jgi:hypothetical protein
MVEVCQNRGQFQILFIFSGFRVCQEAFMAYHGISTYQFYTALKHVDKGTIPATVHGNELLEHS